MIMVNLMQLLWVLLVIIVSCIAWSGHLSPRQRIQTTKLHSNLPHQNWNDIFSRSYGNDDNSNRNHPVPISPIDSSRNKLRHFHRLAKNLIFVGFSSQLLSSFSISPSLAIDDTENNKDINWGDFKLPYNHENLEFKQFLGKATILFNMKIDDPQTVTQFPSLLEIFQKYKDQGLAVQGYPTEQGWFEPDDDETCREKAKVYYGFGEYPHASIFDKIDILGPSAHPLITALTKTLPTPNGYGRITLNYEKFLLDNTGKPVRRYPRKFSAYDMEPDIVAVLKGEPLPPESQAFLKAWREAKRESVKSEYAFRYNYNYYDSPESMYKYDAGKDKI